jgi:carboxymethylenebutenolidase
MSRASNEVPTYSPAAGPIAPGAIRTAATSLETVRTSISSGGIDMPVYCARPKDRSHLPVVIVISEAFGLHEHIEDIARRFAREGYLAVAPDLMKRQGDPLAFDEVGALVRDLLVKIPDGQVMGDLDACLDWAASQGGDLDRTVATGFCWGGRWTWLYAAHRALAAAVVWYGIVDGRSSGLFPDDPRLFSAHPVDIAGDLKTPVLGLYGGQDEAIPLATIDFMRARLADGSEAARSSDIHVYPDAGHAFFADYRGSYQPEAALDGWKRCLAWFQQRIA